MNLVQDHCNPLNILSSVGEVYESEWFKGREENVQIKGQMIRWTDWSIKGSGARQDSNKIEPASCWSNQASNTFIVLKLL